MNNDTPADAMQLKPCPFCQREAIWRPMTEECGVPFGVNVQHTSDCWLNYEKTGRAPFDDLPVRWNTRTPSLAAQDGLVDALRKALHRLVVAAEEDINRDEPEGVDGSEIDAANNAILNSYPQVFTDEQVAKLTGWQECELTHSLTCSNGPHGFHDDDGTPLPDDLFAHSNGLFCPHCDYRQDWAPDVCFGPLPQLPDSFRAALASIEVKS